MVTLLFCPAPGREAINQFSPQVVQFWIDALQSGTVAAINNKIIVRRYGMREYYLAEAFFVFAAQLWGNGIV